MNRFETDPERQRPPRGFSRNWPENHQEIPSASSPPSFAPPPRPDTERNFPSFSSKNQGFLARYRWVIGGTGGVGLILLVASFVFIQNHDSRHEEAVRVIRAPEGPTKIRPDDPGGVVIPHQDKLVYGALAPSDQDPLTDTILSSSDEEIGQTVLEATPPLDHTQESSLLSPGLDIALEPPASVPSSPLTETLLLEDEDVPEIAADDGRADILLEPITSSPTVNILDPSDSLTVAEDDPRAMPEPTTNPQAATIVQPAYETPSKAAIPAPTKPALTKVVSAPLTTTKTPTKPSTTKASPTLSASKKVAKASRQASATASRPSGPTSGPGRLVASSTYRLQLGTSTKEKEANLLLTRLWRHHGDLLRRLKVSISPTNSGPKGARQYTIVAGPLPSRNAAQKLCLQLTRRGAACQLMAPKAYTAP